MSQQKKSLSRREAIAATSSMLAVLGATAAHARQPSPQQNPAIVLKGEPAFEPLINAAKEFNAVPEFAAATSATGTLSQKIKVIERTKFLNALKSLREWMARPRPELRPIVTMTEVNMNDRTAFLDAAHAFALEEYILLSEGRVREAVDVMQDGFRLAAMAMDYSLVGASTGIECEKIALRPLARNFASVSLKEEAQVAHLAKTWATSNAFLPFLWERETAARLARLNAIIDHSMPPADPSAPGATLEVGPAVAQDVKSLSEADRKAYVLQALRESDGDARRLAGLLALPYSEWPSKAMLLASDANAKPGVAAWRKFEMEQSYPLMVKLLERKSRARLLGASAAATKYFLEEGKPAPSIEALKLGELGIDPFTGQPFGYKLAGREYTLESAGPIVLDDKGKADPVKRIPIRLAPDYA